MKIVLYMAVSIDGVAALDSKRGIEEYGSKEDHDFFIAASKKCDAVIMGRNTAFCKISGVPNIVLTHASPRDLGLANGSGDCCANVGAGNGGSGDDRVYMSGTAREVYDKIAAMGFEKVALLGGPATNLNFLRAGLVDEIFLTVEPVTIGQGIRFLNEPLETRWTLADTKVLNLRGTIVLHYVASKDAARQKSE